MSDNSTPTGDATSAILVAVTKIDGKLDTALAVQAIHSTDIGEMKRVQVEHGNRITVLETLDERDGVNDRRQISARAVFWTQVAAVVAVVGLVVTLGLIAAGKA